MDTRTLMDSEVLWKGWVGCVMMSAQKASYLLLYAHWDGLRMMGLVEFLVVYVHSNQIFLTLDEQVRGPVYMKQRNDGKQQVRD